MVSYSFKRRFVDPILAGLGRYEPILGLQPKLVRPKRQTIRAIGKRRHASPGETLQLYTAMRTKQCEKIGEARCVSVQGIKILFGKTPKQLDMICIDGERPICEIADLDDFAALDGFKSWDEMLEFWEEEHGLGEFRGVLIKWEEIR